MRTSKFGASIRRQFEKALLSQKSRHECPKCHKNKLKRKSNSIWVCSCCEAIVAGGAYIPQTEAGEISNRMINDYRKQGS